MPDEFDRESADVNWRWRCHTHGWHLAPNRCCPDAVRFLATEQEGGPPNDVEIDLDHIRERYDQPPAEAPAADPEARYAERFAAARTALMAALDDTDCPDDDHLICRSCADGVVAAVCIALGESAPVHDPATPPGRSADEIPSRYRDLAFNAIGPALDAYGRDYWLPLSVRIGVANAVLDAVMPEILNSGAPVQGSGSKPESRSADEIRAAIARAVRATIAIYDEDEVYEVTDAAMGVVGPERQRADRAEADREALFEQNGEFQTDLAVATRTVAERDATIAELREELRRYQESDRVGHSLYVSAEDDAARAVEYGNRVTAERDEARRNHDEQTTRLEEADATIAEQRQQILAAERDADVARMELGQVRQERDRLREADARVRALAKGWIARGESAAMPSPFIARGREVLAALDGTDDAEARDE